MASVFVRQKERNKARMKTFGICGLFIVGAVLLLYIFTVGAISSNHSVQSYMVLCAGIVSIDLGLLALALAGKTE